MNMIIQCLVLLRKIAGPSGESVCLYFLNGANLLKFCQKGAWPLLDWLNSKTSPCAMSSDTSYCPTLRGSCGGGYEGGVHLFTPRKTGAKRTEKGGGKEAPWCKQKRKNVSHTSEMRQHNMKSCFQRKQPMTHKRSHYYQHSCQIRLRHDLKLDWKKSGIQP